jgi:hypothetical protein
MKHLMNDMIAGSISCGLAQERCVDNRIARFSEISV